MAIRLIEGLHLTTTQKRHLSEMIAQGWTQGRSNRISYEVSLIEGTPGHFRYHWTKVERDDWNRAVTREGRGIVEYLPDRT